MIFSLICTILSKGLRSNINSCRSKPEPLSGISIAFEQTTMPNAIINCIDYLQFPYLSISSGISLCQSNVIAPAQCLWSTSTHPLFHVSTGPSWSPERGLLWAIDQATRLVENRLLLGWLRIGIGTQLGIKMYRTFLHTNTKSCIYDLIVLSYCDWVVCFITL